MQLYNMLDNHINQKDASTDCSNLKAFVDVDHGRAYSLQEKLDCIKYNTEFLIELNGQDLTLQRIQDLGLFEPIKIKQKDGLDIITPENSYFGVSDIRALVGGRRIVDVVECNTLQTHEMTMREFEQYFEGKDRKSLYDVTSFEFSKSKLDPLIQRPSFIDGLDWIDLAWPPCLKQVQGSSAALTYPKVQKYCSMSVAGCYTDFHVDFGGSSSWYHVFKGEKVFWIAPPTNENLDLYERWLLSSKRNDIFFGDMVSKCQRFSLEQGNTLVIPSGWIYSVYTVHDSISFAGNFLSSYNIPMQLRIAEMEEKLKTPDSFLFPFFLEIHWYALERHVHSITGQSYLSQELQNKCGLNRPLKLPPKKKEPEDNPEEPTPKEHTHLTPFEYKGLVTLIHMLENLPKLSWKVPDVLVDPDSLLSAGKQLLADHACDDHVLAVTGKPKAFWPVTLQVNGGAASKPKAKPKTVQPVKQFLVRKPSSSRVRRVRCKNCEACLRDDCKECVFCHDMRKHGGPGTMKQTCIKRRCLNPILPASALGRDEEARAVEGTPKPAELQLKMSVKKEKRILAPSDIEIPAKVQKLDAEEYVVEEDFEDVFEDSPLPRPYPPSAAVTRVATEDLFKYPVRPVSYAETASDAKPLVPEYQLDADRKRAWKLVFRYLPLKDLCNCMLVCKDFLLTAGAPDSWKNIDLTAQRIKPTLLQFLVRRAPVALNLAQTNISYRQMLWLLERSPSLRSLNLSACSWASVAALATASSPPLNDINLSWCSGLSDPHIKHLLSVPKDARPGQEISASRLRFCRHLSLAGTEITDKTLKLLSQKLPLLQSIDVSFCEVSNEGIGHFVNAGSKTKAMSTIIAQYCPHLTDNVLVHVGKLANVVKIDFTNCSRISSAACVEFVTKFPKRLTLQDSLCIKRVTRTPLN